MIDGEKIRRLRNGRDWTLMELGFKVGLSETMMYQIEKGIKKPTVEGLKRLADVFGVTTDELYKEG